MPTLLVIELPHLRKFVIVYRHGAYRKGLDWVKGSQRNASVCPLTAVVCRRMDIPSYHPDVVCQFEKVFDMQDLGGLSLAAMHNKLLMLPPWLIRVHERKVIIGCSGMPHAFDRGLWRSEEVPGAR